jgi:hypothetical protein
VHRSHFLLKFAPMSLRQTATVAAIAFLLGCDESILIPKRPPGVAAGNLTGAAARSVDAEGLFILPDGGDGGEVEITRQRAKELAAAMWHDAAPFIARIAETDRGGPVHSDLQPCPRAFYVASAYVGVPENSPAVIRKALGPYWLVGLCYNGVEEVVVGVSAFATDARVGSGRIRLEAPGIGNFVSMGVPIGIEIPIPPEQIANLAAGGAKRRVASVPRLMMRPRPYGPIVAVWQIALESPIVITGRTSGLSRSKQTFFAGYLNGWTKPTFAAERPDGEGNQVSQETQGYQLRRSETPTEFSVTRRDGLPRVMELISLGAF